MNSMTDPRQFAELESERRLGKAARWLVLLVLGAAILAIFIGRTWLARTVNLPRLFELFDLITVIGSAAVLVVGYRILTRTDWIISLGIGLFIGLHLPFATLFSPYPFFDLVRDIRFEALIRGSFTAMACLSGIVIMRWGGPVRLRMAQGGWRQALIGFGFGAAVGIPLAILNVFANAWTQGRSFAWQHGLAAAMDALQPGVVEEVLYRFAFLGLLWLALRGTWPHRQAIWLAGLLSLLVHTFGHFSDEFIHAPMTALIMGTVLALLWGVPLTVLALRRDLESATGFHWMQDFARFWAGL
ncbi:MAG: CPBP family intramembrane metalloprotease [Caldilineaceae bacterium]|nr:CPBP family intramembrane metalloprotease [Caldilineaceae bacterium]